MGKRYITIDPSSVGCAYHRKVEGNPIEIGGRVVDGMKTALDRYATVRFTPAQATRMAVAMLNYAVEMNPAAVRQMLLQRAVQRPYSDASQRREESIAQSLLDALYGFE